nr:hypothetical protein [Tanacetum cinerariifolium]
MTPRYKNDDHSGQVGTQRIVNVAGTREKQAEQSVPLQAKQYDWLADTDEEVDEQELEAHYTYMAKIQEQLQHSEQSESISNTCLVETDDSNVTPDSPDMCEDDIQNEQNDVDSDDEQTSKSLGESISVRDSYLVALQTKQAEFEKFKAFNDRTINYDKLEHQFHAPTAHDMEILIQTCLMPLAIKTQSDNLKFVHELNQEMHADLKYVESLKKEIDKLASDKAKFSDMYDMILQECVSKDVICSYFQSLSNLDALAELELEKYSIYIELALQKCKEHVKNDTVCNEKASNGFQNEREQYIKIYDLKAKLQDKNIAISELKKLIEKGKGKYVDTKFDRPSIIRQPNAQRIPKPSVLGKPTPFSNSLDRIYFQKTESVPKANVSEGLLKPVTAQTLPQTTKKAVSNTNVLKPRITKKPNVVPISTRKTKSQANKSIVTPNKKKVASKSTNQKPQSYFRVLYENTKKEWKWWIERQSPSGYKWVPKAKKQWVPKAKMQWVPKAKYDQVQKRIVQLILFIVDSRCTKHMTGNLKLLCNFVEKFLGTVYFGNDQFAPILGYEDLVQGNVMINRVYYVEGLNHNLFSVGQFCDADLEATPTQAWLWHRRLSHLNFDYINLLSKKDIVIGLPKLKYVKDQLCSSCELSKAKRSSSKSKAIPNSKGRLNLLHMDLCGPMLVASINGKKYILVIVDNYSRYTWTLFLHSKDETPEVLKDFLTILQRNLQVLVITVRTDRGTEFLNKTLNTFFIEKGIEHQTSTARTPEQNGVVERQNCTLVEAARTMLSALQLPLFFWAEATATACYTHNRSIIIMTHGKIPYHIINDRKPSIKHLHIFGCICYLTRDGENLDKMKEKGDQCILVGYSTQSKGNHVYNKRTRMIVESIALMKSKKCQRRLLLITLQASFPNDKRRQIMTTLTPFPNNKMFILQPMQMFHHNKTPSTHINMHAEENNNDQAEEGEQLQDNEFTNPFCAPTQDVAESSSHNIGNSNVPTFNQP